MNATDGLHVIEDEQALTLWWDKPEEARGSAEYQVIADDDELAVIGVTHFTVTGLVPESAHRIAVAWRNTSADPWQPIGHTTASTAAAKRVLDVSQPPYNAVGDGTTMNTAAIQRALDDCGPTDRVLVPAGTFLTGALTMHSDSELTVASGGTLQGSADPKDYEPRVWSRFEGTEMECYQSLINIGALDHESGPTTRNVRIGGEGAILGGGAALMHATIDSETERMRDQLAAMADYVATCENEHTIPGRVRGRLVTIANAEDVTISGLTLGFGASWNIQMIYSRRVTTFGCRIESRGVWNGDGWDPDSSTDCTIFDVDFNTGDDCVAIKSGKNPEGNAINRPTERVRVFDCRCSGGHGVVIGSEMSGGVSDVRVWDCDMAQAKEGIEIKGTWKRGGYVKGLDVRDCVFPRFQVHAVPYNNDGVPAAEPPVFENCALTRVRLTGVRSADGLRLPDLPVIDIEGFEQPGHEVRDVTLTDVTIPANAELRVTRCLGLTMQGLSVAASLPLSS